MSSKEWSLGEISSFDEIAPKFANLKVEVLSNQFAKITKIQWNDTLRKAKFIYQVMTIDIGYCYLFLLSVYFY